MNQSKALAVVLVAGLAFGARACYLYAGWPR